MPLPLFFYKLMCLTGTNFVPLNPKHQNTCVLAPLLRQRNSSTITIDNSQTLVCSALDTQKCFDTWKENCSETSRKDEFTSKRAFHAGLTSAPESGLTNLQFFLSRYHLRKHVYNF